MLASMKSGDSGTEFLLVESNFCRTFFKTGKEIIKLLSTYNFVRVFPGGKAARAPRRCLYVDVVVGLAWLSDPES
jgi:hypothetical protein